MIDLESLTIKEFRNGLLNKDFSAFEAVKAFFDRIEEKDGQIGAYLRLIKDSALSQASSVDAALAAGREAGILAGVPLAVKDNILVEGEPVTAASKILANYRAAYDATVVKKLKEAGAVFLGKTNMDEFAMGSSTENSAFKITRNPRDPERVPGGSSGGSAAAVAAGMALAALGSDTGGSIRQPAGFCGVIGLKPTYGAVSRFGLIAMASSLDQIGPIAKTVEDTMILFKVIKGRDELDSTSVEFEFRSSKPEVKDLVVGLPKEYFASGLDKETERLISGVIEDLKKSGIKFKEISLPHTRYALSCYYIIMPAEVSANLARFDGIRYGRAASDGGSEASLSDVYFETRGKGFGNEVRRRIILGTFVLSSGYYDAYYAKAQKVRKLVKEDFDKAFNAAAGGVDVILTPVSPTPAFKIGEKISDPLQMYLSDIFTIPVNLAGLPAVSIPVKGSNIEGRLPVGFQLIGRPFCEADILEIGRHYENLG